MGPNATEWCLYVADQAQAGTGNIRAFAANGALTFTLNLTSAPSALAADHSRQLLYAMVANAVIRLNIAHELTAEKAVCTCSTSFFVLDSPVTYVLVRALGVARRDASSADVGMKRHRCR